MEVFGKTQLDPRVAKAFGVTTDISLLSGGIDLKTFRAGDVVLKYLGDNAQEAGTWQTEVFDQIKEDGFRVAKPIKAADGSWIVDGWIAEQFLQGRHATKDDLPEVIDAIIHFHKALVGIPLPEYRKKEQTMYDRADQWAWDDISHDIDPKLLEVVSKLAKLRKPVDLPNQLIHGDLNLENILIAGNLLPAIVDITPYFRPAEFALAVTAFWVGPYEGDLEILRKFKHIKEFDQMLIRAGLRMILTQKDPNHATGLEEYQKTAGIIEQFVTGKIEIRNKF